MENILKLAQRAKSSAAALSTLPTRVKNEALKAMAAAVLAEKKSILRENAKDVAAARARGVAPALLSRLELTDKKITGIADSLRSIAKLPDPVGRRISHARRPNGLVIDKVGVPIGVILIIYESRPNVTADC